MSDYRIKYISSTNRTRRVIIMRGHSKADALINFVNARLVWTIISIKRIKE